MTIETKYSYGDELWHMKENKPTSGIVRYIYTTTCKESLYNEPKTHISYTLDNGSTSSASILENKLFYTKQELLNSL